MTHTPRPWHAVEHCGTNDAAVKSAPWWMNQDSSKFNPVIVTRTNWDDAYLIAAAPEMLAALEDLIEQLEAIGIPDWHGAEGLCLEQAHASIAKAKGSTP
tara:strand:+ start:160 stop:459 length:300 start_codon:yes stop_codon:yes gene_type:complete